MFFYKDILYKSDEKTMYLNVPLLRDQTGLFYSPWQEDESELGIGPE